MSSSAKASMQKYPEKTGVTTAILLEDFMETARALGGPFLRARMDTLGWIDGDIPLVYVPFGALAYALKKGDVIQVKFSQDDTRYPYVWYQPPTTAGGASVPYPVPPDESPQPGTKNVGFPSQSKTDYSFQVLGNGLIVASNEAYACLRHGTTAQYFWSDGVTMYSAGKLALQAPEIDLGGTDDNVVTWYGLQQVMNLLWTALTTTPIAGNGTPQPTWTGLLSLDISSAKSAIVKTKKP